MVQHKSSIELAGVIRRDSFRPVPRVDSAVVVIRKRKSEVSVRSARLFADLVRFMFTQRRKRAKKVLLQYLETSPDQTDLADRKPPFLPDVRVFQLRVSDFERLANEVSMIKREQLE
jgi:16S rRNA (adenine1518-N6/adenine1519-N6)-dimethyltransferase